TRKGQRAVSVLPRSRFIRRIVHGAAEIPDGDDRVAFFGRQREERVVKTGGAAAHDAFQASARQTSEGASASPNTGLEMKTLKSSRSSLSRMCRPPSHVTRSS